MASAYYPGDGVMIATELVTIDADLDVGDKLSGDRRDPYVVERIERELLRRGLDRKQSVIELSQRTNRSSTTAPSPHCKQGTADKQMAPFFRCVN